MAKREIRNVHKKAALVYLPQSAPRQRKVLAFGREFMPHWFNMFCDIPCRKQAAAQCQALCRPWRPRRNPPRTSTPTSSRLASRTSSMPMVWPPTQRSTPVGALPCVVVRPVGHTTQVVCNSFSEELGYSLL